MKQGTTNNIIFCAGWQALCHCLEVSFDSMKFKVIQNFKLILIFQNWWTDLAVGFFTISCMSIGLISSRNATPNKTITDAFLERISASFMLVLMEHHILHCFAWNNRGQMWIWIFAVCFIWKGENVRYDICLYKKLSNTSHRILFVDVDFYWNGFSSNVTHFYFKCLSKMFKYQSKYQKPIQFSLLSSTCNVSFPVVFHC